MAIDRFSFISDTLKEQLADLFGPIRWYKPDEFDASEFQNDMVKCFIDDVIAAAWIEAKPYL